jgi:hypothetical protein
MLSNIYKRNVLIVMRRSELMIQQYHEYDGDGMDPGLGELSYDGSEYELDEFGERIGTDMDEDDMSDDLMMDETSEASLEQDLGSSRKVEDSFGETINPEANPHIADQLDDDQLSGEAEADYANPELPFDKTKG